ncbi:MAG: hypothetical protein HKP25_01005, partial [Marinicaulis sp.]|nr:hypothetical protein [Marinicaulis sp.]
MLKICHAAYAVLIVVGTAAMSPAIAQQEGGQGPLEKITAAATENRLHLDYDG